MKPENLDRIYIDVSRLKAVLHSYRLLNWEKVSEYDISNFKDLLHMVVNACNNTLDYLSKEE